MALSDREQRLLDEMERHLYQSEADVLQTSKAGATKPHYRAIVIGVVLAVVGVGVLVLGVVLHQVLIGIIGFGAMLGGVLYIFSPKHQRVQGIGEPLSSSQGTTKKKRSSGSFTDRMEQRWQERGEGRR